ncbi:RusA family crossover junction endodeoxyribonuclease [Larkinella harenae]
MTQRDTWKQRACVIAYRRYKDAIRPYAMDLTADPLKIVFHLPISASLSKKKQIAHLGQLHRHKPDVDNLLKGLMDAWLKNDQAVASVWIEKRWAAQGGIEISRIDL